MFRFHKGRDIITLFHKPSSQASIRVQNLLKQVSAAASETATEDQASDHSKQNEVQRSEFDLDVTEAPPTNDQLKTLIEYLGPQSISKLIKGANNESDAMKKLSENGDSFQRPVTVDWNNGKAVLGESESEILKMLKAPKPTT